MASDDKEVEKKETEKENEGEETGFFGKVRNFIHDVGEKIEEAVGFGKPTADVTGIHIPSISLEKAELVIDLLVTNPNPIPIPLCDINYLVDSNDRKLISGVIPDAGTIHAHGSETIKVPVTLIFDDIKSAYNDISSGSVIPFMVKVDLIVDIPVFGNITIPLEKESEIPVPHKPNVDLQKVKFNSFSFEETSATLSLKLDNKNDFALGLTSMECDLCLGDVNIGGTRLSHSTKIEKNGSNVVELPISFRPKDFGSALWDMIRGKGSSYSMKGSLEVDTPFGPMKIPFEKDNGETELKNADDDDEDSKKSDKDDSGGFFSSIL